MSRFSLERVQTLAADIDSVFRFFCDPRNLAAITPPWLHFELVSSSTDPVGEGTVFEHKLRVRGVPVRWRSVITIWDPPHRFVDEQLSGPYRSWVHEHRFEQLGATTRAIDVVRYSVPGGKWIDRWLVRPDLERIFDYRAKRLAEIFGDRSSK